MPKTISLVFLIAVLVLISTRTTQAAPGQLDMSFGSAGRVITPIATQSSTIAVQPDGKIVAAAISNWHEIAVARYTVLGQLDPTFDGDGIAIVPIGYAHHCTVALAPDGKIVVVANAFAGQSGSTFIVVRLLSTGSPDTGFDNDGVATPTFTGYESAGAQSIAIQPDGRILVGGSVRPSLGNTNIALVRFNYNGSLDATFGGDGLVVTDVGFYDSQASAVVIRHDGKIFAAGSHNGDFVMVRYLSDGSPDASFDFDGSTTVSFDGYSTANDVAVQPDGKAIVAGMAGEYTPGGGYFALARLNENGSLDTTFDQDGKVETDFEGAHQHSANAVAILQDGRIIAGGGNSWFDDETWDVYFYGINLARYNGDGTLDLTFDGDGKVTRTPGNFHYANDIIVQPDGRILAAGHVAGGGDYGLLIVRYQGGDRGPFDFDRDGRSDVSVFRPSDGTWYLNRSTEGFTAIRFGLSTDTIVPADYDGDGKTDVAIYRDDTWWLMNSSNNAVESRQFGLAGDIPVPADYTGDRRDELAVYRGGQWWLLDLSTGGASLVNFGIATDKPVPGDYDGDGKADFGIFRPGPGEWWIARSTAGLLVTVFGTSTDKAVSGDYTGDGKTDVAFWRPSTGEWFILRSENFSYYAFPFGIGTDIPAPGDFDGDGKCDATVFRPSNATWFSNRTTAGILIQQFGATGDRPVPNAFVP